MKITRGTTQIALFAPLSGVQQLLHTYAVLLVKPYFVRISGSKVIDVSCCARLAPTAVSLLRSAKDTVFVIAFMAYILTQKVGVVKKRSKKN